jgi:hypothetical protein
MDQPKKLTVSDIFKKISNREWAFPDFQRDYVWKDEQVVNLLDSLYHGYPIGMIVVWKPGKKFNGKPKIISDFDDLFSGNKTISGYVIDGMQRILSLHSVFFPQANQERRFTYKLKGESPQFSFVQKTNKKANYFQYEKNKSAIDKRILDYEIAVFETDVSRKEIYKIFGRINAANTPLSGLKFVSAFYAASGTSAIDSLDHKLTLFAQKNGLNRTNLDRIYEEFHEISDIMDYAEKNKSNPKELTAHYNSFQNVVETSVGKLNKFGVISEFSINFLIKLVLSIKNGKSFNILAELTRDIYEVEEGIPLTKKYLESRWKDESLDKQLLYYLLCANEAELSDGTKTKIASKRKSELELHHIFPSSKKPAEKLNVWHQTYITSEANKFLGNLSPSEQIGKINNPDFWKGHFIDDKAFNALKSDSFEMFVERRKKLVTEFLFKEAKIS